MYRLLNATYTLDGLSPFLVVAIIQQANPTGFVADSYFRFLTRAYFCAVYLDQGESIL